MSAPPSPLPFLSLAADDNGPPLLEQQHEPVSASTSQPEGAKLKRIGIMIGEHKIYLKVVPTTSRATSDWTVASVQDDSCVVQGDKTCWVCGVCSRVTECIEEHVQHQASHRHVHRPFKCGQCGMAFLTAHRRQLHERTHASETVSRYDCPLCHKRFSKSSNLAMHMRLHDSGRRFFCPTCGKWFRTHEAQLEHSSACNNAFAVGMPLQHKPLRYQCSYCDKLFHQRRSKVIHERVHTGERPYECGYCGRGFSQSQALTIHIRQHTGEKPYPCSHCDQAFTDSSALRKHEYMHHPGLVVVAPTKVRSINNEHNSRPGAAPDYLMAETSTGLLSPNDLKL